MSNEYWGYHLMLDLDVFSCKPFTAESVKKTFAKYFKPETIKSNFVARQAVKEEIALPA